MNNMSRLKKLGQLFVALLLLATIAGCPVNLVSKYDEQTDANVTSLQKKLDTYFLKLEGATFPDCSFAANKAFYDDISVQLNSAQVRANAIPKNDITLNQLDALSKALLIPKAVDESAGG